MLTPSLLASALLALGACGDTEDTGADDSGSTHQMDVAIEFVARIGALDMDCGAVLDGVVDSSPTLQVNDWRMYISEVELLDAAGTATPVALTQDGLWQVEDVALVDFEDCSPMGTSELNSTVTGTVAHGDYTGLRFTLGVPFDLNHIDAATAPSPLNVGGMMWTWQTGHKFVRIDMANGLPEPDNLWNIHLGSMGCSADASTAAPETECTHPNRPVITLDGFTPGSSVVVADLAALLDGVDITYDTPDSPIGCMANPLDEVECPQLFPNLGLDWATGECADGCSGQTFFSLD